MLVIVFVAVTIAAFLYAISMETRIGEQRIAPSAGTRD